jgi:hypothetical protein
MGMEKIYTCNICRRVKLPCELTGLRFEPNNTEFKFDEAMATDGTHICETCKKWLREGLRQEAIDYTN